MYLCILQTLQWLTPDEKKVFYVNATNRCGGNATACFIVVPLCKSCEFTDTWSKDHVLFLSFLNKIVNIIPILCSHAYV